MLISMVIFWIGFWVASGILAWELWRGIDD